MNSISHQQARTWTQHKLDGHLDEAKISTLNAHLQDCTACRTYAATFEHLDSELKRGYRERAYAQRPVLSHLLSADSAIHRIHKRMRLKMKSKQIMNVATSISSIVVMAVAVIGFFWLLSTRGKVILPGAGGDPLPTFAPSDQEPQLPQASLESLTSSYTKENPLTDTGKIMQVLSMMQDQQIARLLQPGWYVYGPNTLDPDEWTNNYYLLTHTLDKNGTCEFMSYHIKNRHIVPEQLTLSDGHWGVVEAGKLVLGNTSAVTEKCQAQNARTLSSIQNETEYFQDVSGGKPEGIYKAWTEEIGNRRLFVLYYDVAVHGLEKAMDLDTHKLEPIDHTQRWVYFDLDWGTVLPEAGDEVFLLQNGRTVGSGPRADKTINVGYVYYKELPAELKEPYETMLADLEAQLPK